ncbi:hypothetical protein RIF29_39664 [Crotalaria pallida]|uniref:Clp R domain-containing protein n=1 Tax=Crotalaria pallida TaxID=3830 RepID=A0AAN9E7Y6_CROPI
MTTQSALQQRLITNEAATIVQQAVALAKSCGHAEVTPVHVASSMLAVTNGLLRTVCLQSHDAHPLQVRALELCFNVGINRLPLDSTSSTMSMLDSDSHHSPRLSNALVAAFKRALADQLHLHGFPENQQQPLLEVEVEVEQLVGSILDDPSVSSVMRDAGFSSSQVKNIVLLP